jgi:S-adenosylmethionine hydrolase
MAGMHPSPAGIIALLTDFGSTDPYVGLTRGMALRACPRAQVVDVLHDVPPQDVSLAAFFLRSCVDRFPPGTVFVAVVDPGVGTERRALCALAHDCYWVGPDNGVLSDVIDERAEVRAIDFDHLGFRAASRTFHGRDMFAPFAGSLVAGRYGFSSIGVRIQDPVRVPPVTAGAPRVVHVDTFGNLLTNIPATAIASVRSIRVAGRSIPLMGTYGDAPPGSLICLINSYDLLEIAENQGSAAATLGVARGANLELES